MKRKNLLFLLLALIFAPWAANAQNRTIVTIGDGTSTQRYPLPGYYGYQYDVFIYTPTAAPALEVDSDISSIAFNVSTNNTEGESTMKIWVKDVDATYALAAATTFDDYTAGAELVYENDDFSSTTGWNTFAFTRDFSHQGGKALLVAVRGEGCGTTACSRQCTYTSVSNTTWYKHQDNTDPGTDVSGYLGSSRANIQLDLTYTGAVCFTPSGLTYTNVVENAATLSWTENGEGTAWVLEYSTASDYAGATTVNVSGTPTTSLSGLSALTTYYVRVKADCGSDWLTGSFTTTAQAESVGNAWADDFEGSSCGWELINGTITNAWAWGTATNNGGTHALYVSNDGGTTNAYNTSSTAMVYATKLLGFTDGKYEFSYNWNGNGESTYDYLRVALVPASVTLTAGTSLPTGFGTTSLPTGWIALDGGSKLNQVTAWQSKTATINVTAGNYYMVLAWRNDSGGGTNPPAAVDNVSINRVACPYDVTGLAVSEITTSSATLSWEGGEATQWQVAYSTASNFEGATEEIVNSASYNMSGLQSSSTYFVKVRAYCGGEDFGSWSDVLSFATECEAFDLALEDFTENFDGITVASTYSPSTRILPICWSYINTSTYASNAVYPTIYYYSYTDYSNSTPNSLRFYSSYSDYSSYDPQDEYAILPAMENLAGKQITLWIRGYNATTPFKVGMITDPTDASTFVEITNDANPSLSTSYQEFTYIIPADATANHVAIMMEAAISGNSTRGLYIDDIKIADAPTCLKPTELAVTGVSTTTVTLGWTNGADDQTAWQICLNGDEENLIMAESNPFTIEDLTASTTYTAKVRAYCGEDSQSDWSNEVSFTTLCEAISTFPWTENFNSLTAGIPTCWDNSEGTTTTGTYKWNYYATGHDGAGLRFNSYNNSNGLTNFLKTVSLSLPSDQLMQLSFWYKNPTGGDFSVYISTDGGATHETALATGLTGVSTWTELVISLADYAGQEVVIVFKGTSNYGNGDAYIYLDDVTVMEVPTCLKPNGLEVTATTTTTATFSWTAGADETAWQICLNGDETNLIPANSNPFTVEDLTASTAYTAKVRAYCSADDQSDWSNEVSFATECEAIVVDAANPFTEGFEGDWTPLCWESIPYIDGTTTRQWTKTTSSSNIHTGAGAAYSGYYGPIYLVMPDLQLGTDGNTAQLTFWSYNTFVNDYDKNSIVLLDGENEIELWSPESVVNSWEETTIDLTAYMGQTISLAFKYEGNNAHGWYVDDVEVTMTKTFTKTIIGYANSTNPNGGYYLIASPVVGEVTPTAENGFITDDFDLYYFDDNSESEWINWKDQNSDQYHFNIENGRGYLYASSTTTTLTFTGTPNTNGEVTLQKNENLNWSGWNLVGNPLAQTAYLPAGRDFYTMDDTGANIVAINPDQNSIEAMEGIFVLAEEDGETITFSTTAPENDGKGVVINLLQGRGVIDRAIVRFGEGRTLPKFQLWNSTKVYIPMDDQKYAVVRSEEVGELPVSFKAEENGTYTLSFSALNTEFGYLHLVDNMTNTDVDLLATPSYTFEANVTDYANRFKLVFATGNTGDDNFAFFSNGSFVINNEGNATLQVIDVTGRILSAENINGCASVNFDAAAGVYTLRLVNGENVKVQKVVVR